MSDNTFPMSGTLKLCTHSYRKCPQMLSSFEDILVLNSLNKTTYRFPTSGYFSSTFLSHLAVWLVGCFATWAGVPVATTVPPPSPPSGPRSMMWSAHFITSRLCSIMMMVLPRSMSWLNDFIRVFMSWKCRPVVGSSKMNNVWLFFSPLKKLASFTR